MTLIASFEYQNAPVLLADMLITSTNNGQSRPSTSTPLVHTPNVLLPGGAKYVVQGLAQKLLLIHPHLCMAWAGSYIHAAVLARQLRSSTFGQERLDYNELRQLIQGYPREDFGGLNLILYSSHGDGTAWFSNLPQFEIEPLKNIRVAGTGTESFITNISRLGQISAGGAEGYQSIAMRATALASAAAAQQVFDGAGIAEGWGGGFELVTFMEHVWRKLAAY